MEQGKCKEVLCKEAEMFPPINVSGDSDNERNSRISLETMDTDQCIQKLVRTDQEGSKHTQCKIEETIQYWAAQEKKAAMNYCRADEHGCRSQHVSNSNSASVKHLSLLPSPTALSQPTLPRSIHHLSSIIHHQWQLPISSLLSHRLDFPDIQ